MRLQSSCNLKYDFCHMYIRAYRVQDNHSYCISFLLFLLHVMPIFVVYILHQSTCIGSLVFVLARTIVAN